MKILLTILLSLGFMTNNSLEKTILPYGVLISRSDLIVDGKITKVSKDHYSLLVDDFIKGKSPKLIEVKIWEEWTCDWRIEEAKVGQRLILFLMKSEGDRYRIINGSTGELIVGEGDTVRTFMKPNFPPISEIKEGIQQFSKAFEFKGSLYWHPDKIRWFRQLIPPSEVEELMSKNSFFKSTFEDIKHFKRVWKDDDGKLRSSCLNGLVKCDHYDKIFRLRKSRQEEKRNKK